MSRQDPTSTPRTRREVLRHGAAFTGGLLATAAFPAISYADDRPLVPCGVQTGDVTADGAVLWSRADRPARMIVELAPTPEFKRVTRIAGPHALEDSDFTARMVLSDLPAGADVHYRVTFRDLASRRAESEPILGSFRTAPSSASSAREQLLRLQWSGDCAGQGWGINEAWGGMRLWETMRKRNPHVFVHSGDIVYADNPLSEEVTLPDGSTWKNLVTPEKAKVAETLDEFRGNFRYNLLDENLRAYAASTAMIYQWDDHETVNNWYPDELLADDRYTVKSAALLSARARRALFEYTPTRRLESDPERLYRSFAFGPGLEVFVLDMRSYRAPNSTNVQENPSDATSFLGRAQIQWLKQALLASKATWKVIAADMPVGLVVGDGEHFEAIANAEDGRPLGREHEIAGLLSFIKASGIDNVVWLTADVHYAAAHHYSPERAAFKDFTPFHEFVAGPINAGTFGPNKLDGTFGPEVLWQKAPPAGQVNLAPSAGYQFFGELDLAPSSHVLTVSLRDLSGEALYAIDLEPRRR